MQSKIQNICEIAQEAGKNIIPFWKDYKNLKIQHKSDFSPFTQADQLAHKTIVKNLLKLSNTIPILSEEDKEISYEIRKNWEIYWCIDPLDGTKEFITGENDWTINISLILKNSPVLGVVYAPLLNLTYYASLGEGAFLNNEKISIKKNLNSYKIATSRSHLSQETIDFIELLPHKNKEVIQLGSSLKICYVAQGIIDCYPRLAPTMEWDTAASDIIAKESGAIMLEWESKKPLLYNKKNLLNPSFVVANSKEIFS